MKASLTERVALLRHKSLGEAVRSNAGISGRSSEENPCLAHVICWFRSTRSMYGCNASVADASAPVAARHCREGYPRDSRRWSRRGVSSEYARPLLPLRRRPLIALCVCLSTACAPVVRCGGGKAQPFTSSAATRSGLGKAKRHSSSTGTANPMAFGVGMYDACRREIGDSAANPTSAIATVSVAMYVVHSAATPRAAF